MICEKCGNILPDGVTVCDQCGAEAQSVYRPAGASGRRQGRPEHPAPPRAASLMPQDVEKEARHAADVKRRMRGEDAGRPAVHRGTPPRPTTGRQMNRARGHGRRAPRGMMVNWAMVTAIGIAAVFLLAIGALLYLRMTPNGQLIMARMGREANADALWAFGREQLDQGYVDRAVATYEKALEQEPEREDLYDRLYQLADAYEAAGRPADAERIYTRMYREVDKENPLAYREMIRLLDGQNRRLELAAFLQEAYQNTGDSYFRRQREDLLPSTPTASEEAGARKMEQDVALISKEDYDIYYILGDEGSLPEDGEKYTGPIHLGEGGHVIRAVAVSSDLISDELRVQYSITVPTPLAPGISLQPGEYDKRMKIWLRHNESEDEKLLGKAFPKLKEITIYYTVDGQTPTSNSPIFTGDPFLLPPGKCTLKAVAVNGYGKVSNVLERTYKVNRPFKTFFRDTDTFSDFTVMKTTREQFINKFGTGQAEEEIQDDTQPGECTRIRYAWGEARFTINESGFVLYRVDTDSTSVKGPRKTRIGMTEKEVTELFRDMDQAYDQNGDRSLYYDSDVGYGKLFHLDETHDRLDYVFFREDNGRLTLRYDLENGRVKQLHIFCEY